MNHSILVCLLLTLLSITLGEWLIALNLNLWELMPLPAYGSTSDSTLENSLPTSFLASSLWCREGGGVSQGRNWFPIATTPNFHFRWHPKSIYQMILSKFKNRSYTLAMYMLSYFLARCLQLRGPPYHTWWVMRIFACLWWNNHYLKKPK